MLDISIIAGLIPMVCWGVADFLQSIVVRKLGVFKILFLGNVVWTLLTIPFALFINVNIDPINLFIIFIAAVIQTIAAIHFYKSMILGDMSIIGTISGTYSLFTIFLLFIFLGQLLSFGQLFAVFLLIGGIVLTSTDLRKLKHIHTVKGVKESLVALFGWGTYYFLTEVAAKDVSLFGYHFPATNGLTLFFYSSILIGIASSLVGLMNKGMVTKKDLTKSKVLPMVILIQSIYLIAWAVVNYGISVGNTALITAISSLYPAIIVVLALIFYKEKIVLNQKLGIGVILAGLFLLSI